MLSFSRPFFFQFHLGFGPFPSMKKILPLEVFIALFLHTIQILFPPFQVFLRSLVIALLSLFSGRAFPPPGFFPGDPGLLIFPPLFTLLPAGPSTNPAAFLVFLSSAPKGFMPPRSPHWIDRKKLVVHLPPPIVPWSHLFSLFIHDPLPGFFSHSPLLLILVIPFYAPLVLLLLLIFGKHGLTVGPLLKTQRCGESQPGFGNSKHWLASSSSPPAFPHTPPPPMFPPPPPLYPPSPSFNTHPRDMNLHLRCLFISSLLKMFYFPCN